LTIFAAIRLTSSLVSDLAADPRRKTAVPLPLHQVTPDLPNPADYKAKPERD
jgi:hypothetical protein